MQLRFSHSIRHIWLVLAVGMSTLIGAGNASALLASSKPTTPEIHVIRSSAKSSKGKVDITVSFSITSANASSPILQTQVKVGAKTCTSNRTATKCTVKGVVAGKTYKVLVRAKNRNGYSAWSSNISFIANARSSWMRAVSTSPSSVATATPSSAMPETKSLPNSLLNVQECRIQDATYYQYSSGSSGFPRPDFLRSGLGQLEVLVIPVSFADLPFTSADVTALETTFSKVNSYFSAMSYAGASVNTTLAASSAWVDVGGTLELNGLINTPPFWDGSSFYRKVVEIYSLNNSTSGYDVVEVVSAYTTRFSGGQGLPSGSKSIYGTKRNFSGIQIFGSGVYDWNVHAHELGHAWLGFEDLYLFKGGSPLGEWDMMSSLGVEFNGWSRFLAGWLNPNWVICASPRFQSPHFLSALSSDKIIDKPRILVLPLNSYSAVVAELRVPNMWQPSLKSPTLVVYRVDTSIDHGNGPIKLVGTTDQKNGTITTDGVIISVAEIDNAGIVIEVKN